jgi:hypothetical protein
VSHSSTTAERLDNNFQFDCTAEQFLLLVNFAKFSPEKNDFDLHKGYFVKKKTQIRQISNNVFPNRQILMISSSR